MLRVAPTRLNSAEEEEAVECPGSPDSPLKSMVRREYREALARGGTRATVRRLEPRDCPPSPSKRGRSLFTSEELSRRSLSQSDVQKNSAKALNWFRDARKQNIATKNLSNLELPRYPSPKKNMRGLAKMRRAVDCVVAAKHIMHSGVQVGAGAGLAQRLRAKKMQE